MCALWLYIKQVIIQIFVSFLFYWWVIYFSTIKTNYWKIQYGWFSTLGWAKETVYQRVYPGDTVYRNF